MGRNETAITRRAKKLGPATSFTASMTTEGKATVRPVRSHSSSFLWVCSTTTMAASTMAPMAMAMPPSDMMFEVIPRAFMGMKEITIATGMVTMGMIALGMCHRKMRITRETMATSSITVRLRLSIDWRISSERS